MILTFTLLHIFFGEKKVKVSLLLSSTKGSEPTLLYLIFAVFSELQVKITATTFLYLFKRNFAPISSLVTERSLK